MGLRLPKCLSLSVLMLKNGSIILGEFFQIVGQVLTTRSWQLVMTLHRLKLRIPGAQGGVRVVIFALLWVIHVVCWRMQLWQLCPDRHHLLHPPLAHRATLAHGILIAITVKNATTQLRVRQADVAHPRLRLSLCDLFV